MNALSVETLLWLVAGTAVYWATPARWRVLTLAIFGAALLGWHAPRSLLTLCVLTGFTWYVAHGARQPSGRRLMLGAGGILLALLVYRVYSNEAQGASGKALLLGFVFYTLRLMHYLFEVYKGNIREGEWRVFLAWILFFPTLSIGPIHRYQEFRRDLLRQRWDSDLLSEGLERILYGYLKITAIAGALVPACLTPLLQHSGNAPALHAWLLCLEYGALLYFKFSGYSDIAVGTSRLLGFRIIENFHYPFLARNISDFWRRWHISLSSWCREYVYLPVWSRFRNGALAALASMLILGLWHELSWRYLAWGMYHGLGIMVWQRWHTLTEAYQAALPRPARLAWSTLGWSLTLLFVIAGFALTREARLGDGLALFLRLLGG